MAVGTAPAPPHPRSTAPLIDKKEDPANDDQT